MHSVVFSALLVGSRAVKTNACVCPLHNWPGRRCGVATGAQVASSGVWSDGNEFSAAPPVAPFVLPAPSPKFVRPPLRLGCGREDHVFGITVSVLHYRLFHLGQMDIEAPFLTAGTLSIFHKKACDVSRTVALLTTTVFGKINGTFCISNFL